MLTLLARGTAGAAMASVTVHRPSSGNVTKACALRPRSALRAAPFTVPAGLLVMAVPVQAGQTVKAGDTLAVFDAAEVDRAVNAKRAALQQARTQAAQQTAGDTADPYAAQFAQQQLERAYEETHRIYADGEESVSRAQTKRDEAAAALEKARNAGYADDAEKQAAVENAAAALEAAEDALYSAQKPPKMPTMRHFPPPKVPRITATPHCTRWRKSRKPRKNRTHWTAPLLL
ncbi:biotin/lipoyl-binding protein [Gemmiger formicilis]|nr:biotin/lipoyl-binding protein [Gemmiger formicilis]